MAQKTLILSQKQLDEICGGDSSYLDGLALSPDKGNINATEVTADGDLSDGYANPTTTDDVAQQLCSPWRGSKLNGVGGTRNVPLQMHETTKLDWERTNGILENKEHGNMRLNNRRFGGNINTPGKTYSETKQSIYRYKKAAQQGDTVAMRQMEKNWPEITNAIKQYNNAERVDKTIQQTKPEGTKIQSSPKNSGNGKAHSPKNGPQDGVLVS